MSSDGSLGEGPGKKCHVRWASWVSISTGEDWRIAHSRLRELEKRHRNGELYSRFRAWCGLRVMQHLQTMGGCL